MKKLTQPAIVALGVLGAFALPAVLAGSIWLAPDVQAQNVANPAEKHERPRFLLDLAELEARSIERFSTIDSNSDGLLSADEFATNTPQHWRGKRHHKGGKHHRSGPHKKSSHHNRGDREAVQSEIFAQLDTDKNGELSDAEFARQREVRKALRHEKFIERRFTTLDANNDAQISLAEFQQRLEKVRALDADANGSISREELRAHRRAQKQVRREARSAARAQS